MRLTLLAVLAFALPGMTAQTAMASDERVAPPAERLVRSVSGRFVLQIATADGWKTPAARATLIDSGKARWSRQLPHELGPRSALVADDGAVLLLDEWINVRSRRAITLIAPDGRTIAVHDADAVFAAVGVPPAAITAAARTGVWRSSPGTIEGNQARIATGGRTLLVSMKDGSLSVRR